MCMTYPHPKVEDCIAHLHSGQKQWQCHRSEEALYANYLHLSGCTWDLGPKVECCTPWLFSMAQQRPHYFGEALCDWHLQTPSNCFRTQHDHRFGEKRCVNSLPQLGCSLRPCPRVEPITFIVAASDDRTITSEKHTMSKACSNLGVSHTHRGCHIDSLSCHHRQQLYYRDEEAVCVDHPQKS